MFNALFALFSPDPVYPVDLCVLPAPVIKPPPGRVNIQKASDSIIETETSVFGDKAKTKIVSGTFDFSMGKVGKREGSVTYLTTYDEQELIARNVYPQNANLRKPIAVQKELWSAWASIEEMCQKTKLKESIIEKRNAAFQAALDRALAK